MEMRMVDEKGNLEMEMVQEVELEFIDLETIIDEIKDGVVLIDENEKETLYIGDKSIEKLYDLINSNTISKISYINNNFNLLKVKQLYISLKDGKRFTLESL